MLFILVILCQPATVSHSCVHECPSFEYGDFTSSVCIPCKLKNLGVCFVFKRSKPLSTVDTDYKIQPNATLYRVSEIVRNPTGTLIMSFTIYFGNTLGNNFFRGGKSSIQLTLIPNKENEQVAYHFASGGVIDPHNFTATSASVLNNTVDAIYGSTLILRDTILIDYRSPFPLTASFKVKVAAYYDKKKLFSTNFHGSIEVEYAERKCHCELYCEPF